MKTFIIVVFFATSYSMNAQDRTNDSLPYATIPEAPETFTPGTVVSRMIDGLGFRYYWASEGLNEEDLKYAPGNDGRNLEQTLEHIYGLSAVIVNVAKKVPNDRSTAPEKLGPKAMRLKTLQNLREASALFAASTDLAEHQVIFESDKGMSTFPFWNAINGPLEDAIWHAGQLVVMRRSAGSPINPKVNVFLGKLNE